MEHRHVMDLVKLVRVYVHPTLHPNTPQVLNKNEKENWYWERQPPTPSKMTKNICRSLWERHPHHSF